MQRMPGQFDNADNDCSRIVRVCLLDGLLRPCWRPVLPYVGRAPRGLACPRC